jgi:hypothetical protein
MSVTLSSTMYQSGMYQPVPTSFATGPYVGAGGHSGKHHHKVKGWLGSISKWFKHDLASHPEGYDSKTDPLYQYEEKRLAESLTFGAIVMNFLTCAAGSVLALFFTYIVTSPIQDYNILVIIVGIAIADMVPHLFKVRLVNSWEECIPHWGFTLIFTPGWKNKFRRGALVGFEQMFLAGGVLAAAIGAYQAVYNYFDITIAIPKIASPFTPTLVLVGVVKFINVLFHWALEYQYGADRQAYVRIAVADRQRSDRDAVFSGVWKGFEYLILYQYIGVPPQMAFLAPIAIYQQSTYGVICGNLILASFIGQCAALLLIWFYNLHGKPLVLGYKQALDDKGVDPSYVKA